MTMDSALGQPAFEPWITTDQPFNLESFFFTSLRHGVSSNKRCINNRFYMSYMSPYHSISHVVCSGSVRSSHSEF